MNITNESVGVQKLFDAYLKNQLVQKNSTHPYETVSLEPETFSHDILVFSDMLPVRVYLFHFDKNYPLVGYSRKNITFVEIMNDNTLPYTYNKRDENCISIICSERKHNVDFWDYNKMAWIKSRITPKQTLIINTSDLYN